MIVVKMMSEAWQPRPYQIALSGLVKKSWNVAQNPISQVLLKSSNFTSVSDVAGKLVPQPRKVKLFMARMRSVLVFTILPVLLSSVRSCARYFGSPLALILNIVRRV